MATDKHTRKQFMQMLPSVLDGEANEHEQKFVNQQIELCPICKTHYECEKFLHDFIRQKLCYTPLPQDLLLSIQNKIERFA